MVTLDESDLPLLDVLDPQDGRLAWTVRLPGATDETVERLGYTDEVVGEADAGWIALFATGPALTEEAAGRTPSSSSRKPSHTVCAY